MGRTDGAVHVRGSSAGDRDRCTLGATRAETDHVIGHELVHAFQYDIGGHGHAIAQGGNGIERLPLWFIEGMADFYSVGPNDPLTAMWIRDAAINNKLPNYNQLLDPRYFPYRYGQALCAMSPPVSARARSAGCWPRGP